MPNFDGLVSSVSPGDRAAENPFEGMSMGVIANIYATRGDGLGGL